MSLATLLAAANFLEANNTELTRGCLHTRDDLGRTFCEDVLDRDTANIGDWCGQAPSDNTRQMHNTLEKNRRAVLKDCFEELRQQIMCTEDRRSSNLQVLQIAAKHVMALQAESLKLEQYQKKLLQINFDLQHKLRNMGVNEFESTNNTSSPSTDTAEDSPYESDNCQSELTTSGVDTVMPASESCHVAVFPPACNIVKSKESVTERRLLAYICDPLHEAVTTLASLSSCKATAVARQVTSASPRAPSLKLRSLTDAIRVVKRPYKTSPSVTKLKSGDTNSSHKSKPQKATKNRTVVQLLQQSLVQRDAAQQPRSHTVNGKQRRNGSTISQQIAAIEALEAAQSSDSATGLNPSEETQSTIIESDALHKQSSDISNSCLSSSSLLFTLTSNNTASGTQLLNPSTGQHKAYENALAILQASPLVTYNVFDGINRSPSGFALFQVCTIPSTTSINQSDLSLQQPSVSSSSFILCPMMFSNIASTPLFLTGPVPSSTFMDFNASMFTALQPLSMLQVPTVVQSTAIPLMQNFQPVTVVSNNSLASVVTRK